MSGAMHLQWDDSLVHCIFSALYLWYDASLVSCIIGVMHPCSNASFAGCIFGVMSLWWAAYMMQSIYGVLNLWCAASLLRCSFGVMSLLWFIYLLQYSFRCIASLVLCICTFGMLFIGIFGVPNRWCAATLVNYILVAIFLWCNVCIFGELHLWWIIFWLQYFFGVREAAKKKKRFFLGDLSQICLPTHPPQGFCEIWENERWNSGRKGRFSGWFGGVLRGLDLVWESATPPTHIWERSPKKNRFFFLAAPLI